MATAWHNFVAVTLICVKSGGGFSANVARDSRFAALVGGLRANREDAPIMPGPTDVAGTAALSICEALLLALNDRNILPEREIMGVLKDAAAAHQYSPPGGADAARHEAVAALINSIIDGGNSVRRS